MATGGSTVHILMVDDDPLLGKLSKRQLEQGGYLVDVVTAGRTALLKLTSSPQSYDVLITDLSMPDFSGRQLLIELGELACDLPVIVFSGLVDTDIKKELGELGVKAIIEKPIIGNELVDTVRELVGAKESSISWE